jgi:hypothetical protein
MKSFFARSRHNRLLSSFLFVIVGPAERCGLKNFGSLWRAVTAGVRTFQKRQKTMFENDTGASFWQCRMDANPIRVAFECQDTNGTCPSVSWHFWLMGILSEMTKDYV